MKKCPYCAEMIQDEAIVPLCPATSRCRRHQSTASQPATEHTSPVPVGAAVSPEAEPAEERSCDAAAEEAAEQEPAEQGAVAEVTVATRRVLLRRSDRRAGRGSRDDTPSARRRRRRPVHPLGFPLRARVHGRFLRHLGPAVAERPHRALPAHGRRVAAGVAALLGPRPNHVTVDQQGGTPPAGQSTPAAGAAVDPDDNAAVQYTHSGTRYLLGYGRTFFGIWDRQAPTTPVEKYLRDDAGWAAAWGRFTQIESNFTEVSLGR